MVRRTAPSEMRWRPQWDLLRYTSEICFHKLNNSLREL
nr:MAG TPA: hypothetical protein [Caudoviricetes sp.]